LIHNESPRAKVCDQYPNFSPLHLSSPSHSDIFEANAYGYQATMHSCTGSAVSGGTYYTSCDGPGTYMNFGDLSKTSYGPSSAYTINTLQPYSVSTAFPVDSTGTLTDMITTLSQGTQSVSFSMLKNGVQAGSVTVANTLAKMSVAIGAGMVPVVSSWAYSSNMQWLDSSACPDPGSGSSGWSCWSAPNTTNIKVPFSDITIASLATGATDSIKLTATATSSTGNAKRNKHGHRKSWKKVK